MNRIDDDFDTTPVIVRFRHNCWDHLVNGIHLYRLKNKDNDPILLEICNRIVTVARLLGESGCCQDIFTDHCSLVYPMKFCVGECQAIIKAYESMLDADEDFRCCYEEIVPDLNQQMILQTCSPNQRPTVTEDYCLDQCLSFGCA